MKKKSDRNESWRRKSPNTRLKTGPYFVCGRRSRKGWQRRAMGRPWLLQQLPQSEDPCIQREGGNWKVCLLHRRGERTSMMENRVQEPAYHEDHQPQDSLGTAERWEQEEGEGKSGRGLLEASSACHVTMRQKQLRSRPNNALGSLSLIH